MSAVGKHSQPYPWEQRKFSELYSRNVERNSTNEFNFDKTISIAKMRYNSEGNGASKKSLQNYKVIRIGDVAFEGHTNKEFQYGRFVVNSLGNGIMSPRFAVLRPIRPTVVNFWKYYLHNERSMNRILVRATKAGTMMNELVYSDLAKEKIKVPIEKEQLEIGNLFSILDRTITLHEEKHRQLERLKKALLQKMFADETGYPALRFKGFTAKWEQRKLGDITRRYDNLRVPVTASKRKHGDIPYYGANGIQDFVSGYTHDGEFILVAEDGARDPKNYPVNYVNGKIWVNNHAHVLQGIQGLANNLFLLNGIKKINIVAYLVGGSRAKLNAETLMQLSIKLPSIHEQEKIGQLFQSLDKTITLHDKKIQYLKQLKRGLLQKMFV